MNLRKIIKKMIVESITKESVLLRENFYLYDPAAANDPSHDKGWTLYQPLAEKIVDFLADAERLPRFENRMSEPRIVASGAEGIVVSLDDFKVIKLFHTIDNAAKNLNLVSDAGKGAFAQVYSKGVINLDKPVVYWKPGSTHNKRNKNYQINRLFYIIMERITPDRFVFKNIIMELDKLVFVRYAKFNDVISLYLLGNTAIQNKIEEVYLDIIAAAYPAQRFVITYSLDTFEKLLQFINDPTVPGKHKRRIEAECNNLFVAHGRANTTETYVDLDNGRPLTLKMLCLNKLGIVNNFPDFENFDELFKGRLEIKRIPGRKKLPSNENIMLSEDYEDILDLIHEIIVASKLQWRDIHEEQFGRRGDGELIALDIGGKEFGLDRVAAATNFETNVNNVRLDTMITSTTPSGESLKSVDIDSSDPRYLSHDYMFDVDIDDI